MVKFKIELDLDFDGLEELEDIERINALEEIIENGADSKYAHVSFKCIEVFN